MSDLLELELQDFLSHLIQVLGAESGPLEGSKDTYPAPSIS